MESIAEQILSSTPSQETQTEQHPQGIEGYLASLNQPKEEVEQPTKEVEEKEDPRISYIMKKERQLQLERESWKKEKEEMAQKLKRLEELEGFDKELSENPFSALGKKGLDVETLNRRYLETASDEDLDPVAKKFKELESKLSSKDKEWEEKVNNILKERDEAITKKDQEAQINQFKSDIKSFLARNVDEYEVTSVQEDGEQIIFDLVVTDMQRQLKEGKENPTIMSIEDAAKKVEAYLDTQAQKYLNLKKYKKNQSADNDMESIIGKLNIPKTINDDSFTPKSTSVDQLSEEERIKAATELVKKGFKF